MAYEIKPARYAKARLIVRCPSNDGFLTRAGRLARNISSRYTHREHGFSMSSAQARRFERLYAEGWDGAIMSRGLVPPA